jgi:hypothetical protein
VEVVWRLRGNRRAGSEKDIIVIFREVNTKESHQIVLKRQNINIIQGLACSKYTVLHKYGIYTSNHLALLMNSGETKKILHSS